MNHKYPFLASGGEMGQLISTYDWSKTSIGTLDQWPQSLRTTLSILLNSKFPMFLFWGEELLCFYNDAYRPSLGNDAKHPAILGQPAELAWPETWNTIKPLIDSVLSTGEATWSEDQLIPIYRNGKLEDVYWTFSYSSVHDESGQPAGVFVTCSETTQKVQTLAGLTLSQQRFENLVRDIPLGIIVLTGPEMRVTVVNKTYADLIGRTVDELQDKPLFEVIPEAVDPFQNILNQVLQTDEPYFLYDQPYQVNTEQGKKEGFLNLVYQPHKELDGTTSGVMVLCQDVTRRLLAQQALDEKSRDLELAMSISNLGSFKVNLSNQTATYSQPVMDWFGLTKQNEPMTAIYAQIHEQERASVIDLIEGSAAGKQSGYHDITYRVVSPKNNQVIYLRSMGQVQWENNVPASISGIIQDVTQSVNSRQELEASEAKLRSVVDSAPFPIGVYVGEELEIQLANRSIMDVWGKGYDVVGKSYKAILPELETQPIFAQIEGVRTTGIPYHARHQQVDIVIDGKLQPYYFNYSFTPLFDQDGKVYGVMNTAAEVTDLIVARQKLQASEQLYKNLSEELEELVLRRTQELEASNEELAAGNEELASANEEYASINDELTATTYELTESNSLLIRSNENLQQFAYIASHDLQEPLRKIQQFGDILKKQYQEVLGPGIGYLERMQSAASRMSILIRDLLSYSRIATQRDTSEPVSLNQIVNAVLSDLEVAITETGAKVETKSLPTISGDPLQLRQLFQNLLSNALKFRRPDVTPEIQIKSNWIAADHLPSGITPSRNSIAYHRIEIKDNGIGFDEKYLDRIFQVFQRLHGRSEFAGTGIGLAICEKVVTNHGGAITASSQPGEGATFQIYLPV